MSDYCTLTTIGKRFDVSSRRVGKTLKEVGLRTPDGEPTTAAIKSGLVTKVEGPKPWILLWLWHSERVLPFLEFGGLELPDDV